MSIFISLIAMVCLGLAHFINGILSRHYDVKVISFFTHIGGFLIALIAALLYSNFTLSSLCWGALSGVASAWGAIFLYRGMSTGAVSAAVPLSGVSMVLFSLVISILFLGERVSPFGIMGLVFSIPAILFMTWSAEYVKHGCVVEEKRSGMRFSVFSGFGFACQLVTLGEVSSFEALAAVAVSMLVGAMIIFPYLKSSVFEAIRGRGKVSMLAGAISALGLVLYTIAKEEQLLIVSVVLISMYPLVPVILGVLYLKENISGMKALGIAFSLLSIAVLTLGSVDNV